MMSSKSKFCLIIGLKLKIVPRTIYNPNKINIIT